MRQKIHHIRNGGNNAFARGKNSGNRQQFDPVKLKNGIIKSCEKRPVSAEKIDRLVEDIQKQLYNTLKSEISSKEIGELVMDGLKR